jgi:hypothetical protein
MTIRFSYLILIQIKRGIVIFLKIEINKNLLLKILLILIKSQMRSFSTINLIYKEIIFIKILWLIQVRKSVFLENMKLFMFFNKTL